MLDAPSWRRGLNAQFHRARTRTRLWAAFAILMLPARLSADPFREPVVGTTSIPGTPGTSSTPGLEIVSAVSHPSAGTVGVIYLKIANHTDRADRLIAAQTSAAARVEFHETTVDGDMVRMTPRPEGFEIATVGQLVLESGGKHIMLIGLVEPLKSGGSIELELVFDHADPARVRVPILPRSF